MGWSGVSHVGHFGDPGRGISRTTGDEQIQGYAQTCRADYADEKNERGNGGLADKSAVAAINRALQQLKLLQGWPSLPASA